MLRNPQRLALLVQWEYEGERILSKEMNSVRERLRLTNMMGLLGNTLRDDERYPLPVYNREEALNLSSDRVNRLL